MGPAPSAGDKPSSEGQDMSETLSEKKCTPCRGGVARLTHEEAERFRSQTPNWDSRDDGHRIERTFRSAIFRKRSALFEACVSWLKPRAKIGTLEPWQP